MSRDRHWTGYLWYAAGAIMALALAIRGLYWEATITIAAAGLVAWRWLRRWPFTATWVLRWQLGQLRRTKHGRMRALRAWWTLRHDFAEPKLRSKDPR